MPSKILYCSHHRDGGGYASAAKDYLLSMRAAGLDVVARPFRLNSVEWEKDDRIVELENKSARGCDVVIQHTLPHHMRYNGRLKNIGLFASETTSFANSTWRTRLNTMDSLWVPNNQMVEALKNSNVNVPHKVIPHAIDTAIFQQSYEPLDIPQIKDSFVFYFVGELNVRKNLIALLKAFHTEFRHNEPVSLVLKVNKPNTSDEDCTQQTIQMCENVKAGLKLKRAKREIVISQRLTEYQMGQLHSSCHCLVAPSFGEAAHIPSMVALGFGNSPICSDLPGAFEHITNKNGTRVPCDETPVFAMEGTFPDLYLGTENWWSIRIPALRAAMRATFENSTERRLKSEAGMRDVYQFSHEVIGAKIKEAISECS